MKGPLHVIRRRRAERHANETDTAQAATEAPTEAHPTADPGAALPAPASTPPPTAEQPQGEQPTADIPAGQEPIPERPSFRERGRLRRRLRYLRRVRELGFRDLGGLIFDQHKFARVNEDLVRGKLAALAGVDAELRALEHALDDRRPLTELREPGISVCPRCGALHGSEARYCPSCGVPVRGPRAIAEVGEAVSLSVGQIGAVAAPSTPPPSAQPPAQLTLHAERPAAETEPQPAVTEVAEREAAKAEAEQGAAGAAGAAAHAGAEQPTPNAAAHAGAEQRTPNAAAHAGAEQPTPNAAAHAGAEQPTPNAAAHAGAEQPPATEQTSPAADECTRDGEQPTEVMAPIDDETADGVHGAVAQPSGERRES
jgi:ribosomal protein L40E